MEEQLISFKTAKLAKEKGYNITNYLAYDESTGLMLPKDPAYPGWHNYALEGTCPAPTQSLLQKWLREEHNMYISVEPNFNRKWHFAIFNLKESLLFGQKSLYSRDQLSYEEALESGLLEALKLIK